MHDHEDRRMAALGRLLFPGPVLAPLASLLAALRDSAGTETRASLQLAGIVSVALPVPRQSLSRSPFGRQARMRRWGPGVMAGLLVAS